MQTSQLWETGSQSTEALRETELKGKVGMTKISKPFLKMVSVNKTHWYMESNIILSS